MYGTVVFRKFGGYFVHVLNNFAETFEKRPLLASENSKEDNEDSKFCLFEFILFVLQSSWLRR